MDYWQVDVFADRPLSGNGLTVFPDASGLTSRTMQELTQEFRQFESVFLTAWEGDSVTARIFTMEEELAFAGHPVLGAAALCHHLSRSESTRDWSFQLPSMTLPVRTSPLESGIHAEMSPGRASFGASLTADDASWFADAFSARHDARFPAEVVSSGLPYLLLPVTSATLARARQRRPVQSRLASLGAAFVYLLDVDAIEGRTWDPAGNIEDVATGSAAGPVAAYLVAHGAAVRGEELTIRQGRFVGRPSRICATVDHDDRITVSGVVQVIASGSLVATLDETR